MEDAGASRPQAPDHASPVPSPFATTLREEVLEEDHGRASVEVIGAAVLRLGCRKALVDERERERQRARGFGEGSDA